MGQYKNKVFIATSLDGFIADRNGGIDWLESIPEINSIDNGYFKFLESIDAIIMGRNTYEKVLSFGIEWPYPKKVFVLSSKLEKVAEGLEKKVSLLKGSIVEILRQVHAEGYHSLYIDGGQLIQGFLKEDLIDEMIITVIPVLLGDGFPLFGSLEHQPLFRCKSSKIFLEAIVQNHYLRKK